MSEKIASVGWMVKCSDEGKGAVNPIELCEEKHFVQALARRNPHLELIKLSLGQRLFTNNGHNQYDDNVRSIFSCVERATRK